MAPSPRARPSVSPERALPARPLVRLGRGRRALSAPLALALLGCAASTEPQAEGSAPRPPSEHVYRADPAPTTAATSSVEGGAEQASWPAPAEAPPGPRERVAASEPFPTGRGVDEELALELDGQVATPASSAGTGRLPDAPPVPTGRADDPQRLDPTGREAELTEAPVTGRTEGPPAGLVRWLRPDGDEIELLRVPGGPVVRDGQRRNVPEFFVEAQPATLRGYAPFLRARRRAGQDLEGFLPAEDPSRPGPRQASLLRLHLEGEADRARADLPDEPLLALESPAAARYLEWIGLRPLTLWERQRAFEVAGVPLHDVRGGISPRAR